MEGLMIKTMELIKRDGLREKSRRRDLVAKRQYLYYTLRRNGIILRVIANMFDVHHASIIHGIKVYKEKISIDDKMMPLFLNEYKAIFEKIEGECYDLKQNILDAQCLADYEVIKKRTQLNLYPQLFY